MDLDGEDMEVVFGDATEETVPQDIIAPDSVFDLTFHPTSPFLALGLMSGHVSVHEYRQNETRELATYQLHDSGVTGMEFTETGSHLVTVSSDRSINVFDCGAQESVIHIGKSKKNPHKYGISSMNICSEVLLSTGDDDGVIALWDMRSKEVVAKYHEHGDYISQMLFFSEVEHLISSSGDSTLGAFDMRNQRIIDFSAARKDELTCMAFIPATDTIICGTPTGSLPVWKYNSWSRPFDSYEYHPRECDTMVTYNDNIVLTGACDGLVRVLQLHPVKRVLAHLGGNLRRQAISKIRISHDRAFLAVTGADGHVQFLDISFLENDKELDNLRSRAEQRHLKTLREATEAMEAQEREENGDQDDEGEDSDWTDDSKDSDDESSDESESEDEEVPAEVEQEKQMTERKRNREKVAAAKWLKEEKKKKVHFSGERRKRRIQGFWGDLKEDLKNQ